jgi:hypothetical protein
LGVGGSDYESTQVPCIQTAEGKSWTHNQASKNLVLAWMDSLLIQTAARNSDGQHSQKVHDIVLNNNGHLWHPLAHSLYMPPKLILHMLSSVAASFAIFATLGNVVSLPESYGKLLFGYFMKHVKQKSNFC